LFHHGGLFRMLLGCRVHRNSSTRMYWCLNYINPIDLLFQRLLFKDEKSTSKRFCYCLEGPLETFVSVDQFPKKRSFRCCSCKYPWSALSLDMFLEWSIVHERCVGYRILQINQLAQSPADSFGGEQASGLSWSRIRLLASFSSMNDFQGMTSCWVATVFISAERWGYKNWICWHLDQWCSMGTNKQSPGELNCCTNISWVLLSPCPERVHLCLSCCIQCFPIYHTEGLFAPS